MDSKNIIKKHIEDVGSRISETEELLRSLKHEKRELEEELHEIERAEMTQNYLQSINLLSDDNSTRVRLSMQTRTTPIIDSFYTSDKKFLVFDKAFILFNGWKDISIVIAKAMAGINYKDNGMTMTDLKKCYGKYIRESSLENRSGDNRLYPLYEELIKISATPLKSGDVIPFSIPCMLRGQTYVDQTGFGSEYYGAKLVHKGKEYGETTKFFIIGVRIG